MFKGEGRVLCLRVKGLLYLNGLLVSLFIFCLTLRSSPFGTASAFVKGLSDSAALQAGLLISSLTVWCPLRDHTRSL